MKKLFCILLLAVAFSCEPEEPTQDERIGRYRMFVEYYELDGTRREVSDAIGGVIVFDKKSEPGIYTLRGYWGFPLRIECFKIAEASSGFGFNTSGFHMVMDEQGWQVVGSRDVESAGVDFDGVYSEREDIIYLNLKAFGQLDSVLLRMTGMRIED